MNNYTKDQIFQAFKSQPDPVRKFIVSTEAADIIGEIANKFKLSPQQTSELASESGFCLMQLTKKEEFVSHIIERLHIDQQIAENISRDVQLNIFNIASNFIPTEEKAGEISETLPQSSRVVLNQIPEVKKSDVVPPENLPTNLPMIETEEERELVVQKNAPVQVTPPSKGGVESARGWSLPKTFGEKSITPSFTKLQDTPLNLRGEAEPSYTQVQVSPSPPKLGGPSTGSASLTMPVPSPRGGVISSTDQFFVSRPQTPKFRPIQQQPATPIQTQGATSIIDAKLGGEFNMPHEQVNISAPKSGNAPENPVRKIDPYREPIE